MFFVNNVFRSGRFPEINGNQLITCWARELAKGIGAFSEAPWASASDSENSVDLDFEKEYRLRGRTTTTRRISSSAKPLAPGGDDRSAALFGFYRGKGVAFRDDIASAADTGLEKALAFTGDMASAPDIDFI